MIIDLWVLLNSKIISYMLQNRFYYSKPLCLHVYKHIILFSSYKQSLLNLQADQLIFNALQYVYIHTKYMHKCMLCVFIHININPPY